ncbi:glycosyltransferase [Natronomonas salina]|uniref:glycosyltransferase n=1 Tax=Natronomonas salina TaxID=1710540 RepID=UPI001FE30617|nr:glycosyltransferase [Natronomonas salina]
MTSDEHYDVVIGTTRAGAIVGTAVSIAKGIPLVVDHVDPIRQFYETESGPLPHIVERLENLAFRRAAHVLYVYPEEESRLRTRADSYSMTDLGVDYQRFAEPSEDAIATARDRIGDIEDNVAVYVGGLEPIYRIEAMLEAVEHLDNWTLLVAGTGSLESEVETAADQSASIRYLGTVPHEDVPGYLSLSDVGIALVDDPHTLKVLEYGAAGLPVVQLAGRAESRFGGLVTYTDPGPEAIPEAIREAGRSETGEALRTYVRHFDWGRIAEQYARAITTVK